MGIFTLLARVSTLGGQSWKSSKHRRQHALQVCRLLPRRLEPRRVLDASAAGMLFCGLDGLGDYAEVGSLRDSMPAAPTGLVSPAGMNAQGNGAPSADEGSSEPTLSANLPPSNVLVLPTGPVLENGIGTLFVIFSDPDQQDTHSIDIDWGDGSAVETWAVIMGRRFLFAHHQYLDDNPSGTPSDFNTVQATVHDNHGGTSAGSAMMQIRNMPPMDLRIDPAGPVGENEAALLHLTFEDHGTLDSHVVEIDWGDGHAPEAFVLTVGSRQLTASHTYADNGYYSVNARIWDDDLGFDSDSTRIEVHNTAPTLTPIGDQTVEEGQFFFLRDLGTFTDPGFDNRFNTHDPSNGGETVETFTYRIDWGDGSSVILGAPVVDQAGSPGVATTGSLDGDHLYADNGTYTVTVQLADDDLGVATETFKVNVRNVDPVLGGTTPTPTVLEGQAFTLTSLGIRIEDPGFDNPDYPLQAGGTVETFTAGTIDWGDGSVPDVLTVSGRTSGGPFVPTTAQLVHPPHTYADNGSYSVTLRVSDDDGPMVVRAKTIDVANVAPSLLLTGRPQVVDEGSSLVIADLGTFTDPGFDNRLGAPPTTETFHYTIDWGDGSVETGQLPFDVVSGSPGMLTAGRIAASHTYADNNTDAFGNFSKYLVHVTLMDDDGGTTTQPILINVQNVDPILTWLAGTDIDRLGDTTLSGSFVDPGADTYVLTIDWSDGQIEQVPLSGPTPRLFSVTHHYSGPPNPANPAADVEIRTGLLDDDDGFDGGVVFVSNTGDGTHPVAIDTTPQVPRLVFPHRSEIPFHAEAESGTLESSEGMGHRSAVGEIKAAGDRHFELRVIEPDGLEGKGYRLKVKVLEDLPGLFRKLPDNHYAIYLVRAETNVRRLVLDFYVRGGKAIDPGDDSEGARDRPPTEEAQPDATGAVREELTEGASSATGPSAAVKPAPGKGVEAQGRAPGRSPSVEPDIPSRMAATAGVFWLASSGNSQRAKWAGAGVDGPGTVELGAAGRRAHQIDRIFAEAGPDRWCRLQHLARQR